MILANKKMRQWVFGGTLAIVLFLVWWVQLYSPRQAERDELAIELAKFSQERDRLSQRLKKLSSAQQSQPRKSGPTQEVSELVVIGKSAEEVSAYTQLWLQEFLEGHELSLSTYQALSPSKWLDYPLCRVQFNMSATTQGLSDLLESLDNINEAIRIENLSVNYRRTRESDLWISLELGTLFVEGLKK